MDNSVILGINADFYKRLQEKGDFPFKNKIYDEVKSETSYQDYLFTGNYRGFIEWTSIPTWTNYNNKDFKYTISNKKWISGIINIDKMDYMNSKKNLGPNYEIGMRQSVDLWYEYPLSLIAALCDANGNAFDGNPFFANSRTGTGVPNVDNIVSGTGASLAQIYADMNSAIDQILGMVDANGNAFNVSTHWVVMIPGHLFSKFHNIAVSDTLYISGTLSNSLKGLFDICINPYLGASDNDWYLINSNAPVKPFVYQINKQPEWIVDDVVPGDPNIHIFSTSFCNAGYGVPYGIVLVSNTGY
jgi:phage major head subunit gpT-like protein